MPDATRESPPGPRGPIGWMAGNAVAANVLMAAVAVGGLVVLATGGIRQEVYPEGAIDTVEVVVAYPGASPEEVESAAILAIEEAVRDVEGIRRITSEIREGGGSVTLELLRGASPDRALSDTKAAVDRIRSFPEDVERPVVSLPKQRRGMEVISLILYGDVPERALHDVTEEVRAALLADGRVTDLEVLGMRAPEISVEVRPEALRRHGLTPADVATALRNASREVPAGELDTAAGEILLRVDARRKTGLEWREVPVVSGADGTTVRLGELATVVDGFAESRYRGRYDGKRAAMIDVFRAGDQTPLEVSAAVRELVASYPLPPGISAAVMDDQSEVYWDRVDLLRRNAMSGLVLVLLTLGLFLAPRLAFWVTLGIPISFLGALLVLPAFDASINMISLFAFIVTLGIVVDDAIVVGEAVHLEREQGRHGLEAAVVGTRSVAMPVVFGVVTTMIAFLPMIDVPGREGQFFAVIPIVVIAVLGVSLVEALFILPAHLAHDPPSRRGPGTWLSEKVGGALVRFVERVYVPQLAFCLRRRYLTVSAAVAILLGTWGVLAGGHLPFTFLPEIESDMVRAWVRMPNGTPDARMDAVEAQVLEAGERAMAGFGGDAGERGTFSWIFGSQTVWVRIFLVPSDERDFEASEVASAWREALGDVTGAETVGFESSTAFGGRASFTVELTHADPRVLETAAGRLARRLEAYAGVDSVDTGFESGRPRVDLALSDAGRAAGLTPLELGRQLRGHFFGAEALREQRGREELRVYVRRPLDERASESDVDDTIIRAPDGSELPLRVAADVRRSLSPQVIRRIDGFRTAEVRARIDAKVANANVIREDLERDALPALVAGTPGLGYRFGGAQEAQADTYASLRRNGTLALLAMYAMLAVAFRSYVQPLLVMSAIPFGIVGAVGGHLLTGYDMSLTSVLGLTALAGVVINDALILIVAVNERRAAGDPVWEAVVGGSARRFRPILLTSLTTFFGLAPMILERSVQARFLVPMALSLGFGILAATFVTLLLVPALYLVLEDARAAAERARRALRGPAGGPAEAPAPGE